MSIRILKESDDSLSEFDDELYEDVASKEFILDDVYMTDIMLLGMYNNDSSMFCV